METNNDLQVSKNRYSRLTVNERINYKSAYMAYVDRVLIIAIEEARFGTDGSEEPVNPYNPAHLFTPAEIRRYRRLPN